MDLNKIYNGMFQEFAGEILQVLEHFHHYYGEHRVDLHIKLDNFIVLYSLEHFIDYLKNTDADTFANILTSINAIKAIKLSALSVDGELDFSEKTLFTLGDTEEEIVTLIKPLISKLKEDIAIGFIYVHFPIITITNDYGKQHTIKDVYVRINLSREGAIINTSFNVTKACFTDAEWKNNYIHSHITSFKKENPFQSPCLGNGPINNTSAYLRMKENDYLWPLFCHELENYLQVESIKGGPYQRLENLNTKKEHIITSFTSVTNRGKLINLDVSERFKEMFKGFLQHLIVEAPFLFLVQDGEYQLAESFIDTMIKISNSFIDYYNKEFKTDVDTTFNYLIDRNILFKGTVKGFNIHAYDNSLNLSNFSSSFLLTFKGTNIYTYLSSNSNPELGESIFLNINIVNEIINTLLTYINYGQYKIGTNSITSSLDKKIVSF